jgi:hypothetical protein
MDLSLAKSDKDEILFLILSVILKKGWTRLTQKFLTEPENGLKASIKNKARIIDSTKALFRHNI